MSAASDRPVDTTLAQRVLDVIRLGDWRGEQLSDIAYRCRVTIPQTYAAVTLLLAQRALGSTWLGRHVVHGEVFSPEVRFWLLERPPPAPPRGRRRRQWA
jgi:hypothetical protein